MVPYKDMAVEGLYLLSDGTLATDALVRGKGITRATLDGIVSRAGIPPRILDEENVEHEISCARGEPLWFIAWRDVRPIGEEAPQAVIERARQHSWRSTRACSSTTPRISTLRPRDAPATDERTGPNLAWTLRETPRGLACQAIGKTLRIGKTLQIVTLRSHCTVWAIMRRAVTAGAALALCALEAVTVAARAEPPAPQEVPFVCAQVVLAIDGSKSTGESAYSRQIESLRAVFGTEPLYHAIQDCLPAARPLP